jgi:hypothetical protein
MAVITINGKKISVAGNNVTITDDRVMVDGKVVEEGLSGIVEVKWEGPLANLKSDSSVSCGDVGGDVSAGSSVNCDAVHGSVSAGSSVICDEVGNNVSAGSSVTCGEVGGNVTAGSRVSHR